MGRCYCQVIRGGSPHQIPVSPPNWIIRHISKINIWESFISRHVIIPFQVNFQFHRLHKKLKNPILSSRNDHLPQTIQVLRQRLSLPLISSKCQDTWDYKCSSHHPVYCWDTRQEPWPCTESHKKPHIAREVRESRARADLHSAKAPGPGPEMPKKAPSISQNIFISTPPDSHDGSSLQYVWVCQF